MVEHQLVDKVTSWPQLQSFWLHLLACRTFLHQMCFCLAYMMQLDLGIYFEFNIGI